jgi:hypothetical protein
VQRGGENGEGEEGAGQLHWEAVFLVLSRYFLLWSIGTDAYQQVS